MVKIRVSIPEKLMAKLEPIKGGTNISQLCRESLERRVAEFERAAGHDDLDFVGLVQRLQDERPLEESKFEDLGKTNAGHWLNTVPYMELKRIAEEIDSSNMYRYKLPKAAFKIMKQDMAQAKVDCEGGHAVTYKTAWLDYVRSVWTQAADQLEESEHGEPAPEDAP